MTLLRTRLPLLTLALALMGGLTLTGCGGDEPAATNPESGDHAHPHGDDHDHGHGDHDHDHDHDHADTPSKPAAGVPADYPLTVCVVSGEDLGSMGKPVKVEHEGQTAYLCCDSCIDKFEAEPAKYLAKLKHDDDATATE